MINKREKQLIWEYKYRTKIRTQAISILGGKCVVCNCTDIRCLEIDHIIPVRSGSYIFHGLTLYRSIINGDKLENLQILCSCCHVIKTHNNNDRASIKLTIQERYYPLLQKQYASKIKMQAINILGGKCAVCGYIDIRCLEIDHIIPLHNTKRKISFLMLCNLVIKEQLKENLQILCKCCHAIKTYEERRSNHQTCSCQSI